CSYASGGRPRWVGGGVCGASWAIGSPGENGWGRSTVPAPPRRVNGRGASMAAFSGTGLALRTKCLSYVVRRTSYVDRPGRAPVGMGDTHARNWETRTVSEWWTADDCVGDEDV